MYLLMIYDGVVILCHLYLEIIQWVLEVIVFITIAIVAQR